MKIFKKFIFIILFICLLTSCGFVKTYTTPKYFRFEKETTFCITTINSGTDNKIINDLTYELENLGLNTVSEINAKKAISLKLKPDFKYKKNDIEQMLSIKDFNSIYEIRIVYKKNQVYNFSNEFKAWVIDMNNDNVVLYYINANERSLNYILNSFVKKLSEKVNKN